MKYYKLSEAQLNRLIEISAAADGLSKDDLILIQREFLKAHNRMRPETIKQESQREAAIRQADALEGLLTAQNKKDIALNSGKNLTVQPGTKVVLSGGDFSDLTINLEEGGTEVALLDGATQPKTTGNGTVTFLKGATLELEIEQTDAREALEELNKTLKDLPNALHDSLASVLELTK